MIVPLPQSSITTTTTTAASTLCSNKKYQNINSSGKKPVLSNHHAANSSTSLFGGAIKKLKEAERREMCSFLSPLLDASNKSIVTSIAAPGGSGIYSPTHNYNIGEIFMEEEEDYFIGKNQQFECMEVLSLLSSFKQLATFQQNVFLSHLLKNLSYEQIHLMLRKLNYLMTINFIGMLPVEISCLILSFLDNESLFECMLVNRNWNQIIQQSTYVWKCLFYQNKTENCQCERLLSGISTSVTNCNYPPYKALLKRHLQVRRNWKQGHYRLINVICQDVGVITVVQFDTDIIIMGTDDGHVLAGNPKTGQVFHSFEGHMGGVWALQYIDNLLVTGSTDRTIRVWDIQQRLPLQTLHGHRSTVRCLGLTADGKRIISGSRDHSVRIWDVEKGVCLFTFDQHHVDSVRCLAVRGCIAVTGSYDTTLRVWHITEGRCLHTLKGHVDKIYSLAFKDDIIVSGGHTGTVKVWNSQSGECLFNLYGHNNLVSTVLITPHYIGTGSTDCTVRHWDRRTGALLTKYTLHTGSVSALISDEYRMLTGSDASLKLWDVESGQSRELLPDVNVIWRVDMNETTCVATGDSVVEVNGARVNSSTLHIFHFE